MGLQRHEGDQRFFERRSRTKNYRGEHEGYYSLTSFEWEFPRNGKSFAAHAMSVLLLHLEARHECQAAEGLRVNGAQLSGHDVLSLLQHKSVSQLLE